MKAIYRNSIRSREMIREALISLLDKKSISDITVTDIVSTANINRGTFYNHYNNPIEIVEEIRAELLEKLVQELKKISNINDVDSLVDLIIEYVKKNEKDYKRLIKSVPASMIDDMKKALIQSITLFNQSLTEIELSLIINAISGVFIDYLKGSLHFTYEEVSKKIKEFIRTTAKIS